MVTIRCALLKLWSISEDVKVSLRLFRVPLHFQFGGIHLVMSVLWIAPISLALQSRTDYAGWRMYSDET